MADIQESFSAALIQRTVQLWASPQNPLLQNETNSVSMSPSKYHRVFFGTVWHCLLHQST